MPRGRVRSTGRRNRRRAGRKSLTGREISIGKDPLLAAKKGPKLHRFIGLALGGAKTDKTCLAVIEYFPEQNKIFLSRLFDKIKTEGEISSDLQVHSLITQFSEPVESVAFDVPITLPHCIRCEKKCPGLEACTEESTQWMWKHYRAKVKAKPKKLFTPYTERCVEQYMESQLEEPFHVQHALGSNLAPLTARAQYIIRRLNYPVIEVFPKISFWRIGISLEIAKSHLRSHRHWEAGQASREALLTKMMDRNLTFIYEDDIKILRENAHAFDAFICAMTGLLAFQGNTEPRPKGFPKSEGWVQIPKEDLVWSE